MNSLHNKHLTFEMGKCVKCLQNRQLNETITIKRDTNKNLFKTLFKDDDAAELIICKICFGEYAEFLNEEDFIDEIPAHWMQDDEQDNVQDYEQVDVQNDVQNEVTLGDFDCEHEIVTHQIIATPAQIEQNQQPLANNLKESAFQNAQKNQKSKTSNRKSKPNSSSSQQFSMRKAKQKYKNFSNTVFTASQQFRIQNMAEIPLNAEMNAPCMEIVKEEEKIQTSSRATSYVTQNDCEIIDDSNSSTSLDKRLQIVEEQNTDENTESSKSTIAGMPAFEIVDDSEMPTFEIDDESDNSSVHFVDEVQLVNGALASVENIQANNNECQNLSSVDEQMRLLNEFEKQCETWEVHSERHNVNSEKVMQTNENYQIITNIEEQSFICSNCGQISNEKYKIQEHIACEGFQSACKDARIEEQKLECGICCEYCGLFYRRSADLQAHRATGIHADFIFTCRECSECFEDFEALNNHKTSHNVPCFKFNPMYMCNVGNCVETCLNWSLLNNHKNRSHVAQICPNCREQFHDSRFFTAHVKNCKGYAFKCVHCQKKYQNTKERLFLNHIRACLRRQKFHCEICDLKYSSRYRLRQHNNFYHQPKDCSNCGKVYRNQSSLQAHLRWCTRKNKDIK